MPISKAGSSKLNVIHDKQLFLKEKIANVVEASQPQKETVAASEPVKSES